MDAPDDRPVDPVQSGSDDRHVLLVPLKSFDDAKERLAPALERSGRRELAERLARGVVVAAAGLDVAVVCAGDDLADWSLRLGARVVRADGAGLVADLTAAVAAVTADGARRVTIVPGDLARPGGLRRLLDTHLDGPADTTVLVVPDRRRDGTNLLSIPTGHPFRLCYGVGSADAHAAEARRLGLPVTWVPDPDLGWDVDVPDDLRADLHTGAAATTVPEGS